jgi:hypothetical protein
MPSLKSSAADRLHTELADPDPDVRIRAVLAIAAAGSAAADGRTDPAAVAQSTEWLTEVVLGDPDPDVVAAAIGVLALLVGPRCEQALCEARDRFPGSPAITHAVTRALTGLDQRRR